MDNIKTKGATPLAESAPFKILQANDTKTLKWRTTLLHLLQGPQHRFQGEAWGDHALPSTVASLARDYGLSIEREWTEVPTRFGSLVRVKAYWVSDASRERGMRALDGTLQRSKAGESE